MKKRYLIIVTLVIVISTTSCNASKPESLKDYDIVMLTKTIPDTYSTAGSFNTNREISECSSFVGICELSSQQPYGTVYYINHQDTPVTLHIKGESFDYSIQVLAQSAKGVVWENASPYQNTLYLVTLTSTDNELLHGHLTLASSDGAYADLDVKDIFNSTITCGTFITSPEDSFSTTLLLTQEQPFGRVVYVNRQDTPATMTITGVNREEQEICENIKIEPFDTEIFNWSDIPRTNSAANHSFYTVTIRCEKGYTLNGYLTVNRAAFCTE